jgi:hypothetical protein
MHIAFMGLVIVVLPLFLLSASAGDLIRWTDESGTVHFTDSLDNVPERYRAQVKHEKFKEEQVPQRNHPEKDRVSSDEDNRCLEVLREKEHLKLRCTMQEIRKRMEDRESDEDKKCLAVLQGLASARENKHLKLWCTMRQEIRPQEFRKLSGDRQQNRLLQNK